MIREKDIEQYLVKKIKEIGGKAYKFVSPGNAGVPDRVICLPRGRTVFVELKAPGKTPTPLQRAQINKLTLLGHEVWIIDDISGVDKFIQLLRSRGWIV